VRYMGGKGQSSNPDGASYHPQGLPLVDGLIEVVTDESSQPGERHAELLDHEGEVAIRAWKGVPENPATDFAGVGWIRAVEWMPFQRDTFVTPPFAAYTSGHSTFSRAAAEILTRFTGSAFFPGGLGQFSVQKNAFLEFEAGPTEDLTLTWATYYDAADEAGLSRLYGGIHVPADDLKGRIMGNAVGEAAYSKAKAYFDGQMDEASGGPTYADWSQPIEAVYPDSSDVGESLQPGWATNLERFFFGTGPLEPKSGREGGWMANFLQDGSTVPIEVRHVLGSKVRISIETSTDMRSWERVDIEDHVVNRGIVEKGLVRTFLEIPSLLPQAKEPYYLRMVLEKTDQE